MSRKTTMIPKRIAQIRFSLMDPVEIRKMSSVEVKTPDTYKDDGHAYRQGLMDPHMGVIEPGLVCPTDNCKYDESHAAKYCFTQQRRRIRPILNFLSRITTVLELRTSSPNTVLVPLNSRASSRKSRRLLPVRTDALACTAVRCKVKFDLTSQLPSRKRPRTSEPAERKQNAR